jgi:hypothetical protein
VRTPRIEIGCLALLLALLCVPAQAADLVVHGPASPSDARARAALARGRSFAGSTATDAIHVSEVPAPSAAAVWVVGGVRSDVCSGKSWSVAEVEAEVNQAIDALDGLDDETARGHFDDARAGFVCLSELVDTETVWLYHFHRGVLAFNEGDADGAQRHFVDAVLADPESRWDTNYSPDAQQIFLAAREHVLMSGVSRLEIHDPDGAAVEVRVDGETVESGSGQRALTAGPHLVQYRTRSDKVHSVELEVSAEQPAALLGRGGLDSAILAGVLAPGLSLQGAQEALAALAAARGVERVIVAADTQPDRVHTFVAETGAFVIPPPAVGADRWRLRPGPRVGLALGGGVLLQRSDERGSRGTLGAIHLGVEIRIVAGLAVDLAATLGAGSFADDATSLASGTNVVPLIGVGLRYAFGYRIVRPYIGARAVLRPNEQRPLQVGAAAAGGVVVLPHGPLRIQVELSGGWAGIPHFGVTAAAGVAF